MIKLEYFKQQGVKGLCWQYRKQVNKNLPAEWSIPYGIDKKMAEQANRDGWIALNGQRHVIFGSTDELRVEAQPQGEQEELF